MGFIKKNRGGFLAVAILALIIALDSYKCPIYAFTNIPCPTCGVSRALWSLLYLDIAMYIEYNAMAVFLLSAVVLMFFRSKIRRKTAVDIYVYSVLAVNTVYYTVRLILLF